MLQGSHGKLLPGLAAPATYRPSANRQHHSTCLPASSLVPIFVLRGGRQTMGTTSKTTQQSPHPNPPLKRGLRPLKRGFHLPSSADGAAAEADGRGDRRRHYYFENGLLRSALRAQSPSPSPDRGFGPFFVSHFHACVVSAGGHAVYSISLYSWQTLFWPWRCRCQPDPCIPGRDPSLSTCDNADAWFRRFGMTASVLELTRCSRSPKVANTRQCLNRQIGSGTVAFLENNSSQLVTGV